MFSHLTSAHLEPDSGQQAEDAQFYRQVLHELIHIGTDLARLLNQQAIAHAQAALQGRAPSGPPQDHTTAFDRVARAIRRSITLARSLAEPAAPARNPAQTRAPACRPIIHKAEDAPKHPANTPGRDAETPSADQRDRPDAPDRDEDEDISTRPVAEIIAEICRDLGLDAPPGAHPWQHRTPADTGQPCTRSAAPSTSRQPSPQPGIAQAQGPSSMQPIPGTQPAHAPPDPAATPRPTVPTLAGSDAPGAADPIATILRPPAHLRTRWRPPSES